MDTKLDCLDCQREKVERGAAWLDKTYPDWYREINLEQLEMLNPCKCILGQAGLSILRAMGLHPDKWTGSGTIRILERPGLWDSAYYAVWDQMENGDEWAEAHGFTLRCRRPVVDRGRVDHDDRDRSACLHSPNAAHYGASKATWDDLEEMWVEQIKARYEKA